MEEVPQLLCTYEEVLDAYHAGLQVPEFVLDIPEDAKYLEIWTLPDLHVYEGRDAGYSVAIVLQEIRIY